MFGPWVWETGGGVGVGLAVFLFFLWCGGLVLRFCLGRCFANFVLASFSALLFFLIGFGVSWFLFAYFVLKEVSVSLLFGLCLFFGLSRKAPFLDIIYFQLYQNTPWGIIVSYGFLSKSRLQS